MVDIASPQKQFLSDKVTFFTESVIREMTRQAMLHGAVNLAQGFPDFPAPSEIKKAAQDAIAADVNQYAITWGAKISAQCHRPEVERVAGIFHRSRNASDGLLRID
jgi:L-glutamine---4-(methylsulfanyl)-2-oxobutanoate aminotransferase